MFITVCLRGHSKISVLGIRKDPTVTDKFGKCLSGHSKISVLGVRKDPTVTDLFGKCVFKGPF